MTRTLRFRDIIAPSRKIAPYGWRTELVPGSPAHSDRAWSEITEAHRRAGRTLTPRSILASQLYADGLVRDPEAVTS